MYVPFWRAAVGVHQKASSQVLLRQRQAPVLAAGGRKDLLQLLVCLPLGRARFCGIQERHLWGKLPLHSRRARQRHRRAKTKCRWSPAWPACVFNAVAANAAAGGVLCGISCGKKGGNIRRRNARQPLQSHQDAVLTIEASKRSSRRVSLVTSGTDNSVGGLC